MANHSYSRSITVFRVAIFLLLSAAVFGWGLHYKLSLYHSTSVHAISAPVAKLLSPRERMPDAGTVQASVPNEDAFHEGAFPLALSFALISGWLLLRFAGLSSMQALRYPPLAKETHLHLVSLFFRPPPFVQYAR